MDSATEVSWSKFGIEKIGELIDAIKLAAPEVWRIYNRQARIEAVTAITTVLLIGIGLVVTLISYDMDKNSDMNMFIHGALAIVLLGDFVVCCIQIPESVGQLLNPQYHAIQRIVALKDGIGE